MSSTDEVIAALGDPATPPEEKYRLYTDLQAAALAGDAEAGVAVRWLRLDRSDRTGCDVREDDA
ncbi:hypothetical protein [Actinosynnema sp. NPDC020468]|uniref:hypothetical protein n=1 Tax=Actinosynnema sp. NPDC020468 TaxID=3154488 RepID=UPI0033F5ABCB